MRRCGDYYRRIVKCRPVGCLATRDEPGAALSEGGFFLHTPECNRDKLASE